MTFQSMSRLCLQILANIVAKCVQTLPRNIMHYYFGSHSLFNIYFNIYLIYFCIGSFIVQDEASNGVLRF